jgi:hypothetical protein
MEKNTAAVRRRALALFNFMGAKQQNNKRIGDLTLGDFVEMCRFLTAIEPENQASEPQPKEYGIRLLIDYTGKQQTLN